MIGRVYLARHKKSGKYYAIKCMKNAEIARRRNMKYIKTEIELAVESFSPFIVRLYGGFQDKANVYLLFEYAVGGELYNLMGGGTKFAESKSPCLQIPILPPTPIPPLHSTVFTFYDSGG